MDNNPSDSCSTCSALMHKCDVCGVKLCVCCPESRGAIAYCQGCVSSACFDCFHRTGFRNCRFCSDATCSACGPTSPSGCFSCSHSLCVRLGNKLKISGDWKTYDEMANAQKARDLAAVAKSKVGSQMSLPCEVCRKPGASFACSACVSVLYCNLACQRRDWKAHKLICKHKAAFTKQL